MRAAIAISGLAALLAWPGAAVAGEPLEVAEAWWQARIDEGAIAWPAALTMEARAVPWAAGTRVRLEQRLMGVPVDGHDVILSLDPRGGLVRVHGEPLSTILLDPAPTVAAWDAAAVAEGWAARAWGEGRARPGAELRVWVDLAGRANLVWRLTVLGPEGPWRLLVHAHDSRLVRADPARVSARADVYATNPAQGGLVEVELPGIDGDLLDGPRATVRSCVDMDPDSLECGALEAWAQADGDGDFFYGPDATAFEDPLAEVNAYYHLDRVSAWFSDQHAFEHPQPADVAVNMDFANAFYGDRDGDGTWDLSFGQAEGVDLAYDADVVYHEFGHSVAHDLVGDFGSIFDEHGFDTAPGGLDEGSADLFAAALSGDPLLAEYAAVAFGYTGSLRDLEPDRLCPDDIHGQSHQDGLIWASLGWNLADDVRVGPQRAAELFYGAMTSWPEQVTWAIAGQSLADAALDMADVGLITDAQVDAVLQLADESGVLGCGRVMPLDDGQRPTLTFLHWAFMEGYTWPMPMQFSLDAPPEATALDFRIDDVLAYAEGGWRIFVRRGEHVVFDSVIDGELFVHQPVEYDDMVEGVGPFQYQLRPDREPLLEPGATYYFALTTWTPPDGSDLSFGEITVSGNVETRELTNLYDDDDGAGCDGCGAALAGGPGGLWLLLFASLIARRGRSPASTGDGPPPRRR